MMVKHLSWLVLIVLLITSCGVSELKKRYHPEVLKQIERIIITEEGMPAEVRVHFIELGFIEVHDNALRSWEYLEFMAKAQAYQYYGDVDMIIRATSGVESPNPPYNMEKYIRGAAVRFTNPEMKALFFEAYDKWIKENIK